MREQAKGIPQEERRLQGQEVENERREGWERGGGGGEIERYISITLEFQNSLQFIEMQNKCLSCMHDESGWLCSSDKVYSARSNNVIFETSET